MAKRPTNNLSFSFDEDTSVQPEDGANVVQPRSETFAHHDRAEPPQRGTVQPSAGLSGVSPQLRARGYTSSPPPTLAEVVGEVLEQIARDHQTLRMDSSYWIPNREFYEQRIQSYTEYLGELRG